jgi:hypothetical protein
MRQTIFLLLLITACRKNDIDPDGGASLTIVNSVQGTISLVTNFSGTDTLPNHYINAKQLIYNSFDPSYQFNAYKGKQKIALYNYPDTLLKDEPLLRLELDLPVGSIHSLFVTGTVAAPDTLFIEEHPPYRPVSDSTTGIRFMNLVPGSSGVSVNLAGQANGSEANLLHYKEVTAFKSYAATSNVNSYTFEFRDAANGALLASYTAEDINNGSSDLNNPFNKWRFRNCTLALLRAADDTNTVLLINNY